jgi:uncharacterized protein DUF1217
VLTTLASYRIINEDLTRSLSTTAARPQVARETSHYLANIDSVKSIDDFMADDQLFNYAMKAYGLEDMSYAKAFMRKVLESDLSDTSSFANQLSDKRYLEFAKAFNFLPSGSVDVGQTTAQDSASEDAMIGLYSQQRTEKGAAAAVEAAYYKSRIANITNVDDLLSDQRLFSYALTAFEINPNHASVSAIRDVLTSDLSDPNSVANRYASDYDEGAVYLKLAAAFSFETDGSVAPGGSAQTSDQLNQTMLAYYESTGTDASPAAAAFKTEYFNELLASVTNVDDLVNNTVMRDYVATAAGLDPLLTTAETVRGILVSDLSDPASAANESAALKAVAEAFNFNTDGSLDPGASAQDADQAEALSALYFEYYDDAAIDAEDIRTKYYKSNIGNVIHVDDLLKDSWLFEYALSSHGIDPAEVTKSKIKKILLSDSTSASSFANLLGDSRFTALAEAFNFDADGYAKGVRQAQSDSSLNNTTSLYASSLGELQIDQKRGEAETEYYRQTIGTITSTDQLLGDQRLKAYIVKAYAIEGDTSNETLRKVFTSDLFDQDSFVNQSDNGAYKALAVDFNFGSDGKVLRSDVGAVQDRSELAATRQLYLRQTVETDAGEQNAGVRLALYFERKAEGINTAYDILADEALLKVVQTTLSLPATMSLLDLDRQADLINDRLDLEDLKDPRKLAALLTDFAAKWDIDNATTTASSSGIAIGQPVEFGVNIDLLSSIQNLKLGGF